MLWKVVLLPGSAGCDAPCPLKYVVWASQIFDGTLGGNILLGDERLIIGFEAPDKNDMWLVMSAYRDAMFGVSETRSWL